MFELIFLPLRAAGATVLCFYIFLFFECNIEQKMWVLSLSGSETKTLRNIFCSDPGLHTFLKFLKSNVKKRCHKAKKKTVKIRCLLTV